MTEQNNKIDTEAAAQMLFDIKRIYVKDISFESPSAPEVFNKDWQPEIQMDMNFSSNSLSTVNYYEVALRITLTAKVEENTAFLCEVVQAGIFEIDGLEGEQLSHCLNAYCPNILFPYARECISSLITRGTFQPINLMPVNFDALFMQYLEQQKNVTAEASNDTAVQAH